MKTKWNMDRAHTQVRFNIKHMALSTIWGEFDEIEVHAETNGMDFNDAEFTFSAMINSIRTGNKERDTHLKSYDFFAASDFPKMFFNGKSNGEGKLFGHLTMRGISHPIELAMHFGGIIKEGDHRRAGMEFTGTLNRKDFGLNWSALTEAGNLVVSDRVDLVIDLQLLEENTSH